MTRNEVIQKQIDYIMDTFDFSLVRKAMKAFDWNWESASSDDGVPEESDLRMHARSLLYRVAEDATKTTGDRFNGRRCFIATGGFRATCEGCISNGEPWVCVNLDFILEDSMQDGETYSLDGFDRPFVAGNKPQKTYPHQAHCNGTPYREPKVCNCNCSNDIL